jgi:hypothetical protein
MILSKRCQALGCDAKAVPGQKWCAGHEAARSTHKALTRCQNLLGKARRRRTMVQQAVELLAAARAEGRRKCKIWEADSVRMVENIVAHDERRRTAEAEAQRLRAALRRLSDTGDATASLPRPVDMPFACFHMVTLYSDYVLAGGDPQAQVLPSKQELDRMTLAEQQREVKG